METPPPTGPAESTPEGDGAPQATPAAEPKAVELVIRKLPDGNVAVIGPLQNKELCYGLLGIARDMVSSYKPEQQKPGRIIQFPGHMNNGHGVRR